MRGASLALLAAALLATLAGQAARAAPGRPGQAARRGSKTPEFQLDNDAERLTMTDASGAAQKRDAETVLAAIETYLSSEEICQDASRTLSFQNRGEGEGLGSLLNGYLITWASSLMEGKRLCVHEAKTLYVNASTCASQSWSCLFEPVSTQCPCAKASQDEIVFERTKPKRCFDETSAELFTSNGLRTKIRSALQTVEALPSLPLRDDHWYMALFYHYALRPNARLLAFKEAMRKAIFPDVDFAKDAIACHVRRGDHWMGEHLDDQAYLESIRAVASATGASVVLLASDDFAVLKAYPDQLAPLRVVSVPSNYTVIRELEKVCVGMSRKCSVAKFMRSKEATDEGLALMAQILLMTETMVTIGSLGSNFARVIHQLQWARAILSGEGTPHPMLSFFDMVGAEYFACGWRHSGHLVRDNASVRQEWVARYKYYKSME